MEEEGFGVNIAENAALAVNAAAADLLNSQTQPALLRSGVLNAFHAVELLLKIKLEMVQPVAPGRRLSNTQVLSSLQTHGVYIGAEDLAMIAELRTLRNKLQHSEARYGFRDARALLQRFFIYIDRFTTNELDCWLGQVVEQPAWDGLLALAPIEANASAWTRRIVAEWVADDGLNSIGDCPTATARPSFKSEAGQVTAPTVVAYQFSQVATALALICNATEHRGDVGVAGGSRIRSIGSAKPTESFAADGKIRRCSRDKAIGWPLDRQPS